MTTLNNNNNNDDDDDDDDDDADDDNNWNTIKFSRSDVLTLTLAFRLPSFD